MIDEGFDVVIRVGTSPDWSLIGKYLFSRQLLLYASPDYLHGSDAPLYAPDDLVEHRCLFMSAVSERPQWRLRNGEETRAIDLEPTFSCDDFSVLQQLALYGLGITQLPDYMGEKHVEDGSLVRVLDHWIGANVDFHALVRSRRGVTPKIRVFLDFMTQSKRLANSPPTRI